MDNRKTFYRCMTGLGWVMLVAGICFIVLGAVIQNTAMAAPESGALPKIVKSSPQIGETDVDPELTEITVTFDQDMAEGMSWTGGKPDYPPLQPGKESSWRDKRTCVLPVKLSQGKYYRVGINAPSFQNFQSVSGVPVDPTAIYFTTKGASQELKNKVMKPEIVSMTPANKAKDVDPKIKSLRVTFNVPMGESSSWTGGGDQFPKIPQGKKASWTKDHKTCILPVELKPDWEYRLGLNSPSYKNFTSASGIPLEPVEYTFKTKK
jgi:hypothetical protein